MAVITYEFHHGAWQRDNANLADFKLVTDETDDNTMIWIYLVFIFVAVTAAQQFGERRILFVIAIAVCLTQWSVPYTVRENEYYSVVE